MPWTLVALLIIAIPLTAVNTYVGKTILLALTELTNWGRARLRKTVVGSLIFLNVLPAAYFVAFVVGGRSVIPAFSGDSFILDLFLSYPFWIGLVAMIQLLFLFGVLDVLDFTAFRLFPSIRAWWRKRRAAVVVGITCLVFPYTLAVVIHDTWTVRIAEHQIPLPEQLKCFSGFRIAQISDVQGDGRTTYNALRRYVEKVNSLKADVVLFGGDLVTSGTRYIDSSAAILGLLRSRLGTFAAVGDHEFFTDKSMVVEALNHAGVRVVEDSTIFLGLDSCRIALGVITYTYRERPSRTQLRKIGTYDKGAYRILLAHQPAEKLVEYAKNEGYDLMLAGHTHGGGLAFGIPGLFLLAPANFESPYVSGLYHLGGLDLSVTNGLGLTLAPVRFHAPAEIVLITLK